MQKNEQDSLHVLIIVNRLFEWSQNFITRELTELNEQGVRMHIATRKVTERDDLTQKEEKLRPKAILMPENPFLPGSLYKHLKTAFSRSKGYGQAWKALFSLKHKNASKFFRSVICLFRAAFLADAIRDKDINLIHAHFLTAPGDTALYLSRMTGIPYGGTAHAMDIYTDNSGLAGKVNQANYLTTCTAANEKHLKSLPEIPSGKVIRLYHGIEVRPDEPDAANHRPFTFIAVGRMVEKKGFGYLIEACRILKKQDLDFQLNFVGNGPLEDTLKNMAADLGLSDRIHFKGFVPPNEMSRHYSEADVLVMPSIVDPSGDRDGLPNVCLEAMNHGLPIVGSEVSGIPEGVFPGENGWLVPPGDPTALAGAMAGAIHHPDLHEMKKAARSVVSGHFSLERNIGALRQLMEQHFSRT